MIIYNVTVKVESSISDDWLRWLQVEHIPEILATGCFSGYRVARLLEVDDEGATTYTVQYEAPSQQHYQQYIDQFAPSMRAKSYEKWGDRFIAFRTVMEVVK